MKKSNKLELKFERIIPTSPSEAFAGWLNPKIPGTPWNESDKLILNPKVDGFFYWLTQATPHYGRFTKIKKSSLIQHTWMSPYTEGLESTVTVSFKKKGADTLMTLVHSGLPDSEKGKAHNDGWTYFLNLFPKSFGKAKKKK